MRTRHHAKWVVLARNRYHHLLQSLPRSLKRFAVSRHTSTSRLFPSSSQIWNTFSVTAGVGKSSEKGGGAHMGFFERVRQYHLQVNWNVWAVAPLIHDLLVKKKKKKIQTKYRYTESLCAHQEDRTYSSWTFWLKPLRLTIPENRRGWLLIWEFFCLGLSEVSLFQVILGLPGISIRSML